MPTVNYLRDVGCVHVEAKVAEINESYRKATEVAKKPMKAYLYNQLQNKHPKIANSTGTSAMYGGA